MRDIEELMDHLSKISKDWSFQYTNNKYLISASSIHLELFVVADTLYDGLNKVIYKIEAKN